MCVQWIVELYYLHRWNTRRQFFCIHLSLRAEYDKYLDGITTVSKDCLYVIHELFFTDDDVNQSRISRERNQHAIYFKRIHLFTHTN